MGKLEERLLEVDSESEVSAEEVVDEEIDPMEGISVVNFYLHVTTAFRCAFWCAVCALPVMIPSIYNSMDPKYAANMNQMVMMLMYTIYKNMGLTIQLVYQGFTGTFLACLIMHILGATMPGGAMGDHYNAPVVHTVNCLFLFGCLFVNMGALTRLYCMCYYCYFMMEFMNPNSLMTFNTTWAIDWDSYTATTLVTLAGGLVLAFLAMSLPPLTAQKSCRTSALRSVSALTKLMKQLVDYFERSSPSVKIYQSESGAVALREEISTLQEDLDGSWWEGFDMGVSGQIRGLLQRHLTMMQNMSDNIFAMQVCIAREDFGETHQECMRNIKSQVHGVVESTKSLLDKATHAANDGTLDAAEKKDLQGSVVAVKEALAALASAFGTTRQTMFPDKVVTTELQSESFFVYCLSVYGRHAVDYTESMLEDPIKPVGLISSCCTAFKQVFDTDVLFRDVSHRSYYIRNTISMLTCYYLGFWLMGYNGVPAGTASLLLTTFTGSALQKNLGRLQGVVLGNILPHIFVRLIGTSCSTTTLMLQFMLIICWEVMTCYVYYSSPNFGYVGCLAAGFALPNLVYPCTPTGLSASASAAAELAFGSAQYQKIVSTALAIIVMTCVDLCLSSDRASTLAVRDALHALLHIDAAFQSAFLPRHRRGEVKKKGLQRRETIDPFQDVVGGKKHGKGKAPIALGQRAPGEIGRLLSSAQTLGNESNKEPRLHRAPWPEGFFNGLIRSLYVKRAYLQEFEHATRDSAGNYSDIFAPVRSSPAFESIQKDLNNTMGDVCFIVQEILRNETRVSMPNLVDKMSALEGVDKLDSMKDLIDDLNNCGLSYPVEDAKTLEDDYLCRIHVVLMIFDASVSEMGNVVKMCIKMT